MSATAAEEGKNLSTRSDADLAGRRRRWMLSPLLILLCFGLAVSAQASAAEPAPAWSLAILPVPTNFNPAAVSGEEYGPAYYLHAKNIGGAPAAEGFTITDTIPAGLAPSPAGASGFDQRGNEILSCSSTGQTVTCTGTAPLGPGELVRVTIPLEFATSPPPSVIDEATIAGGGAPAITTTAPTTISAALPSFGFLGGSSGFYGSTTTADGSTATQAGSHPAQLTVGMSFPVAANPTGGVYGVGHPRDIRVDLPRGVVVDPDATPVKCTEAELESAGKSEDESACPPASQVGTVSVTTKTIPVSSDPAALYNMVPPPGSPAELGFEALKAGIFVHLLGGVRSGGDYGLNASSDDTLARQLNPVLAVEATLWGDPSSEVNDLLRGSCLAFGGECPLEDSERTGTAFLTTPSACSGPLLTEGDVDSWEEPGVFAPSRTYPTAEAGGAPVGISGCERLDFSPTITVKPTVTTAETPSGLSVDLHVPQDESYEHLAEANLKDAKVVLPAGIAVDPSAADGLGACTEAQIELHGASPATCPDAAKIGTVAVDTPLLDHPLPGAIYVATPYKNPFGSLLAIYVAVYDEQSGVVIKLAGHVEADQTTGQLTATFSENPELPFEDFHLDFFGGPRAALKSPNTCGSFSSRSELDPWSGNAANVSEDSFPISAGAGGGACASSEASLPNNPGFEAGTLEPQAGSYSPFVLHLHREDGSQQIGAINATLPPGLLGKLAGIPYCPDAALAAAAGKSGAAEQSSPSCPAASEIGKVTVGAGAGSQPYYVGGKAYLAGPYKGAPLSLAIITPAVAGPYDLGTVVVRSALYVDPMTSQITVKSDPIPRILQGIPLDVRSIAVEISRPQFTLNPTSCEPMALGAEAVSTLGQVAPLSSRFKAEGCRELGFKPKLKVSLKGSTTRTGHPALKAVVTYPKQGAYANIRRAQVNLPHSEFIDQGNLNKTCTKPVLLEGKCPARSIYGKARAWTPLLEKPLEGPVYLVGGFGYKLPALVAELNGQIRVVLKGKVDSGPNHGIRNTFEAVPDAPVSRFVLEMKGGKKYSLLENSEDLCRKSQRAIARFTAQNGKVEQTKPMVANQCGKKSKKKKSPKQTKGTKKHH